MSDSTVEFIRQYWLLLFVIFAIGMYFFAWAGFKVQEDAKKRGFGKAATTFWSVSVVFFGPIFLPLYFIFRARSVFAVKDTDSDEDPDGRYKLCPHCGERNPYGKQICIACSKPLDPDVETLGQKACPYCNTMNPVDARRCSNCEQVIGYTEDTEED